MAETVTEATEAAVAAEAMAAAVEVAAMVVTATAAMAEVKIRDLIKKDSMVYDRRKLYKTSLSRWLADSTSNPS